MRTVAIPPDDEREAEIRELGLGHTAGRQPSPDSSLLGLSACRRDHLTPTQAVFVGLVIPAGSRGWSRATFPRASHSGFKRALSSSSDRLMTSE